MCCRAVRHDEHWTKNNCFQLCQTQETRVCNAEACTINCQLTEFGPWSECSPCAKKSVSKTHTGTQVMIFMQMLVRALESDGSRSISKIYNIRCSTTALGLFIVISMNGKNT